MSTFDDEMYSKLYIETQADTVAKCMCASAKAGIDSDDFAEKLMTSDYGIKVMTDQRMIEYSDSNFMLSGFMKEMQFKKGKCYDYDVLYLTGYLYKYWVSTRRADPVKVYRLAPIKKIGIRYEFYHTQDIDYIIDDLIARPESSLMND